MTIHLDDDNGTAFFVSLGKKKHVWKVNRKGGVFIMYLHPSLDCVQSEKRLKQNKEYCCLVLFVWVHNLSSEAKTRI